MTPPPARRFVIDMYSSRYPLWCMPEADVEEVRAALSPEWELLRVEEEADGSGDGAPGESAGLRDALSEAEVYCGFGIPREVFGASTRLRWVHSGAAGVGGSLYDEMLESDVIFTNSAATHGVPVAEHAVAMMFYFARGLDKTELGRRAGSWERDRVSGFDSPISELTDSVVGILGYGGIGREIAERAKGLGMKVWALKRTLPLKRPDDVDELLESSRLRDLLAASDYVVVALPHTQETDRLIGADELTAMKASAVLINVARGRIVDEDALIEALAAGRIRGAGLDVFWEEPLPQTHPLWSLDNVCLTPHVAGVSPRFWDRETKLIVENTRRYLAGEPMLNVVNKQAGY